MKPVILLGGLPASGKTWVCEQLPQYVYVRNDDYMRHIERLIVTVLNQVRTAAKSPLKVITDCPFGIRERRTLLEKAGLTVLPYFIYESPVVLWERYQKRSHKPLQRAFFEMRAPLILERAKEWNAPVGTSAQILAMLKG